MYGFNGVWHGNAREQSSYIIEDEFLAGWNLQIPDFIHKRTVVLHVAFRLAHQGAQDISQDTGCVVCDATPARNNRPEGEIWFVDFGEPIYLGDFFCCGVDPVFQLLGNGILTLPTLYDVDELPCVGGSRVLG